MPSSEQERKHTAPPPPPRSSTLRRSRDLLGLVLRRLAQEFDNGKVYYDLQGRQLRLPKLEADRPDRELLRWPNENVLEKGRAAYGTAEAGGCR